MMSTEGTRTRARHRQVDSVRAPRTSMRRQRGPGRFIEHEIRRGPHDLLFIQAPLYDHFQPPRLAGAGLAAGVGYEPGKRQRLTERAPGWCRERPARLLDQHERLPALIGRPDSIHDGPGRDLFGCRQPLDRVSFPVRKARGATPDRASPPPDRGTRYNKPPGIWRPRHGRVHPRRRLSCSPGNGLRSGKQAGANARFIGIVPSEVSDAARRQES